MADILKPDLCVIGAGATGVDLALRARQRGLGVVLVPHAGTDLVDAVQGGLRRAAFMASAARAHAIQNAGGLGLDNAKPKINFRVIGEHADAVAAGTAPLASPKRLTALGITLLTGAASFSDRQTLQCGDTVIKARHFALATGAQPLIPAIQGLDQVPYFTPDTIQDNIRKLSHLVVIGGQPEAFELAQAYVRLGSQVTLVPQGGLLPGFDPELVAILLRALRAEGLTVLDDAEVSAIVKRNMGTGVVLKRGAAEDNLDVSHILVAMGRVPWLASELLDKANLRRDKLQPDHLSIGLDGQTSNARISAIGGAAGQHQPHVATRQASLLVERLLGVSNGRLDPLRTPLMLATQPALAQVGAMEPQANLRHGQTVLRANLAETDAARAQGQPSGAAKLMVNANGSITAGGAVGHGAGETIGLLALAMAQGLSLADLGRMALPQSSPLATLIDLADQHQAAQPAPRWGKRLPGIGRVLP